MKDFFIRLFMSINAYFIRMSHGRIGGKLGTQTILLLHTIGRKSRKKRATPIAYFYKDGHYLLVESNWGKDNHADWYLNLLRNPQANIDVNGQSLQVRARITNDKEYDDLWGYVTKLHPPYLNYQKVTARKIPIVVLEKI
jgi:deazaflavin-dependent oxidoreductase (nitroreductase family)